jgi:hypothetical protein
VAGGRERLGPTSERPTQTQQVLDYIEARAEEPCGPSFYVSFHSALAFIESCGEVTAEDRMSGQAAVLNLLEELKATGTGTSREKKKAPLLPVILLVALELLVCDSSQPAFDRGYAWYRLVRIWSVMRFNDSEFVDMASLSLNTSLDGIMTQTKTTGAGKPVGNAHFSVCKDAWLAKADWLRCGFELWRSMGSTRQSFLPLPNPSRDGFIDRPASYADATACARACLASLPLPELYTDEEGSSYWVSQADRSLFVAGGEAVFSEHSDRNFLPSWAALTGSAKDDIDRLGWKLSSGDEYIRASRLIRHRVQSQVAVSLRDWTCPSYAALDLQASNGVVARLMDRGVTAEVCESQAARLSFFEGKGNSTPALPPSEGSPILSPVAEEETSKSTWLHSGVYLKAAEESVLEKSSLVIPPFQKRARTYAQVPSEAKGYIISFTKKRKISRLHYVGCCHRLPGIFITDFEEHGEEEPEASQYMFRCKDCFAKLPTVAQPTGDAGSSDSSSSLHSSTTEEEQGTAAPPGLDIEPAGS